MPKVTVVMPVYNGSRYLQEAIDSILGQTFQDFEFLIINDGSTDNTREIICSYDDSRIQLVNNDCNLGLTRSLNKGLELAEGEFVARQDADDISEPERLAKQVAFLETHPEVALLGTWCRVIDSQGNQIENWSYLSESTQIRWGLLFHNCFAHSSVMFCKSTIIEQIGYYNEVFIYAQDYDLWCRIARSFKVVNLREYLIKYRASSSSMTATYGSIIYDEPYRIRMTNIEYLLECEKTKKWNNQVQFDTMTSLWNGFSTEIKELNLLDLDKSIKEILRLHNAFCQYYKLERLECKNHSTKLYTSISRGLVNLAHNYLYQENYTLWQLLFRAYSLNLPIFLSKRSISLIVKLLIGPHLFRRIRYFRTHQLNKLSEINSD